MEEVAQASRTERGLSLQAEALEVSVKGAMGNAASAKLLDEWALVFEALREFIDLVERHDRRSRN